VNGVLVEVVELDAATGAEPFGAELGFGHDPDPWRFGSFTWLVVAPLSIEYRQRLRPISSQKTAE
jgi:hypothetical protein